MGYENNVLHLVSYTGLSAGTHYFPAAGARMGNASDLSIELDMVCTSTSNITATLETTVNSAFTWPKNVTAAGYDATTDGTGTSYIVSSATHDVHAIFDWDNLASKLWRLKLDVVGTDNTVIAKARVGAGK